MRGTTTPDGRSTAPWPMSFYKHKVFVVPCETGIGELSAGLPVCTVVERPVRGQVGKIETELGCKRRKERSVRAAQKMTTTDWERMCLEKFVGILRRSNFLSFREYALGVGPKG